MKNEKFNGFNDLHVSEHAKAELLHKIEKRKIRHSYRLPAMGKIFVSLALIGAVMIYASSKSGSEFLDYETYLTISAEEVDYPMQKIQQEMIDLDFQFESGIINEAEYQQRMKELRIDKDALEKKADELKQQFNLDQKLDLNKIKFSSDPYRDQQLKEFYLQKTSLEDKEAVLNSQKDQLINKYEAGEIAWQEYIDNKLALDQEQADLSIEMDQWEADYAKTDSTYQKLYEQKKLLEQQEEALEIEEDQLKEQFKQGLITQDEYKLQKQLIELKEDELDIRDDQLDDLEDDIEEQMKHSEKESDMEDDDDSDDAEDDNDDDADDDDTEDDDDIEDDD